jgi:glycolate oxidase iron-sulfur subunit
MTFDKTAMQTSFTPEQLRDPAMQASEKILRTCVHCGFCTATCPTYVLLGDELDSPRGRIYLMKEMLESGKPATPEIVKHIDRCLSCLACMTTCPSGVHYMHLVDHGRAYIEATYRRPWHDRLVRWVLGKVLPYPNRFRLALLAARVGRPFAPLLGALPLVGKRMRAMLELAPARLPGRSPLQNPGVFRAEGPRRGRVAILSGCAQPVLQPGFNEAAIRLLNRHGIEVVQANGEGCCGALVHHMGWDAESHAFARRNIDAWIAEIDGEGLDAIVITASGCGTTIKDYGFMFRTDPLYADKARRVSEITKDISEYLTSLKLMPPVRESDLVVAYHSACSMQHGQQIREEPKKLLKQAGFTVKDVPEGHICCGSAGTYNILQPKLAGALRARKVANIERVRPDLIATGNIGCMTQIEKGTAIPIVHTVELLDWATGGPMPARLREAGFAERVASPTPVAAE